MIKKLVFIGVLVTGILINGNSAFALVSKPTLTLTPTPTPTPTTKQETVYDFSSMTTYEMFWPVVAGKVPGDQFYSLKVFRDKLIASLFVTKSKKSEYLKRLANKRLMETEKLLELKRESYFPDTLTTAIKYLEEGARLLAASAESQQQAWLKSEYIKDLQKYVIVLERMQQKVGESEKPAVEKALSTVKKVIQDYKLQP